MNYRNTTILAETDLGASGTKDIEIKIKDIISRINLAWKVTKSKHAMDSYAHKDISRIELKCGSDVLFGMDGGQCQALNIYDRLCKTMNHGQHMTSLSEYSLFGIDFGRYLFDPELALDPSKFESLILYITFNEAIADTGATVNGLKITADVFDEKLVSPIGFLSAKEQDSHTPSASGYDYVKLPTDQVLRKLLIQGYRAGYEPWYQVSEARLDEDNEKRIPFDHDLELYYRMMKGVWAQVQEEFEAQVDSTGADYYVTPTDYYATLVAMPTNIAAYIYSTDGYFKGGKATVKGNTGNSQVVGVVQGYLPNHCFEFAFGDPWDINDWYDVTKVGDLRLRLKAGTGGANGTVATIIQQLRRYGGG